jgi:hypothetical protein
MWGWIGLTIAALVGAGFGYFVRGTSEKYEVRTPVTDLRIAVQRVADRVTSLGCRNITESGVIESNLIRPPLAVSYIDPEDIQASIKLSPDRKTLSLLHSNAVGAGIDRPIELNVVIDETDIILAFAKIAWGQFPVAINPETGRSVVSRTGQTPTGVESFARLMQCSSM